MIENIIANTSQEQIHSVSCDEVHGAIQRLNNGKASDGIGITAEHIKKAGHSIIRPLTHLFDLIFAVKEVPEDFKKGITIPIPKKDKDCLCQETFVVSPSPT